MPIDFRAELNDDQLAAVTSRERFSLVLAGAGSGKTRTLTYRVAWLLEQGVAPWRILLLTFTNKAATEMLERVEALTGVPRSEFWGGTFHSIGQRILRANAELVGRKRDYTILDAGDADTLFGKVCRHVNAEFLKGKNAPKPRVIFDLISYARNTRLPLADVVEDRMGWVAGADRVVPQYLEAYAQAKREQNLCDFDDLLELFLELLDDHPDVRERLQKRFRHILVDEFQDTNTLQAEIIRRLVSDENHLTAVGDDAQCIYTWRGANYENITRFPETYAGTVLRKIEINYRSTPQILDFANSILSAREESLGFSKTLRATREDGRKPALVATLDAYDQARTVIRRIASLVEDEGYSPNDVAVLYRAHMHAKELELELTRAGIPFLITSGVQFFQQAHVRDFVAILRFLTNPADGVAFARLLALMEKVGPRTAAKTLEAANRIAEKKRIRIFDALLDDAVLKKIPEPARDDYSDFVISLQDMDESLRGNAFDAAGAASEDDSAETEDLFSLAEKAAAEADADARDVPAAASVTGTPAEIVRIGLDSWYGDFIKKVYADWRERLDDLQSLVGFAEKFDSLDDLLAQLALLNSETNRKDVDADSRERPMIRLSTIHQAKGLEYPIVFVIGCAEEMFPLKRAVEEGDVDEERRLFYVACTRAKDRLYLLYPKIRMSFGDGGLLEASRFVREADPDTYERLYLSGGARSGSSFPRRGGRAALPPHPFRDEYSQETDYDDSAAPF